MNFSEPENFSTLTNPYSVNVTVQPSSCSG
jgi:hypothetical protein